MKMSSRECETRNRVYSILHSNHLSYNPGDACTFPLLLEFQSFESTRGTPIFQIIEERHGTLGVAAIVLVDLGVGLALACTRKKGTKKRR